MADAVEDLSIEERDLLELDDLEVRAEVEGEISERLALGLEGEPALSDSERALASAARAAAYLGNVRRKAVEEVTVKVRPATRGRATGWSMTCPTHGPMPVLLPSKEAGIQAGEEHIEIDHPGAVGTVDAIDRTSGTKPRKKKRRRG